MSDHGFKADSVRGLLVYLGVGALVGFLFQCLLVATSGTDMPVTQFMAAFLGLALVFWLLSLQDLYRRQRGMSAERRSPWGERRLQPPRPYDERLSGYLGNDVSAEDIRPSRMPFWAGVNWREQESTAPKPVWFIRRILQRIHEAVRGGGA